MGTSRSELTVRCPRCGQMWSGDTKICPADGASLHDTHATGLDGLDDDLKTELDARITSSAGHAATPRTTDERAALGSNVPLAPRSRGGRDGESALTSGLQIGEYQIEHKIGEGAMGVVYRAVHPTIDKHVAIKVMSSRLSHDAGAIERFTREARSVSGIRHPGIVDVFGFGVLDDGRAYLIMELLDGETLRARLDSGPLELDEALDTIGQLARALEVAHERGVIHRDLKPDNVFLQRVAHENPIVKILDFGLAKLVDEDRRISRTQTGQLLGTPLYMSPEQCKAKNVDQRTDIYALGCISYELICGRVPFGADNFAELIAAHLSELPPRPRELSASIPPELDALLYRMVAKDPDERPTLRELRKRITAIRGTGFATPLPGTLQRADLALSTPSSASALAIHADAASLGSSRRTRTSRLWYLGGAALAAGLIAVLVARWGVSEPTRDDTPSARLPLASALPPARGEDASELPAARGEDAPPSPATAPAETTPTPGPSAMEPAVAPSTPPAPRSRGTLALFSDPPCQIWIDGKPIGRRTPQPALRLSPGRHAVTLVNPGLDIKDSFTVDVKADTIVRRSRTYARPIDDRATIDPFSKKKKKTPTP